MKSFYIRNKILVILLHLLRLYRPKTLLRT